VQLFLHEFPAQVIPPCLQGRDMYEPVPRQGHPPAVVWSLLLATCICGEHAVRTSACLFSPLFTTCIQCKHVVIALCSCSSSGDDDRQLENVVSMLWFGRFQEQSLLILLGMQLVDGMEATLWWSFEAVEATTPQRSLTSLRDMWRRTRRLTRRPAQD
jgi:hypothetical protein